jgi:cold shock CspA family protein
MGRSQETFNKKEVKNKKDKKRKEKEKKRLIKKESGKSSFDDMIAYVDEFGKISSTPPDPSRRIEIETADIELGATKNDAPAKNDFMRTGVVTFFNDSKGFGFIKDSANGQSVFVHINNVEGKIRENDSVSFEIGKGPKGPTAQKVKQA